MKNTENRGRHVKRITKMKSAYTKTLAIYNKKSIPWGTKIRHCQTTKGSIRVRSADLTNTNSKREFKKLERRISRKMCYG